MTDPCLTKYVCQTLAFTAACFLAAAIMLVGLAVAIYDWVTI